MPKDYHVIIIGAGVIGLAVARSLAESGHNSVLIIDKEKNFGRVTSSRNSEVIHSGIYYPSTSLKAKYCLIGRKLLYEFCKKYNVWHQQCGKLIVAQDYQEPALENLYNKAIANGVPDVEKINKQKIEKMEPRVIGKTALFVGCSGIISAHEIMSAYFNISQSKNHDYLFKSRVNDSEPLYDGYEIFIENSIGEREKVTSEWVINAGGLQSDLIARMVNNDVKFPELTYSKGCYFRLSSKWRNRFKHLVYPMPDKELDSLGIHLSFDQSGNIKLGPSAHWMENKKEDYTVEKRLLNLFYHEAKKYIKGLKKFDLSPDYAGIRPKMKTTKETFSDFYIAHENEKGFPGWINLIGIDSPGLTAAIAIGEDVAKWIDQNK